MTKDDYPAFISAWRSAMSIYGKDLEQTTGATIFALLMHYSLDDIAEALDSHLCDPNSGQFPPKPADIVRNIQRVMNAEAGRVFDIILRRLNPYASVQFTDQRAAGAVCALGGWLQLCEINNNEIERTRARFIEAYHEGVKPRANLLKGKVELHNEQQLLPRKPELVERFPHPVLTIDTRKPKDEDLLTDESTKEIGHD